MYTLLFVLRENARGEKHDFFFNSNLDSLLDIIACTQTINICTEAPSICKNPKNCNIGAHVDRGVAREGRSPRAPL